MTALISSINAGVNLALSPKEEEVSKPTKTTRAEGAYAALKNAIRSNRMPPGTQAPEPELAAQFGVGRATLREALIRLEAEGMVELIPRRGARVRPIRADDMREVYEILMALEPDAAARLATRKPTPAELAGMEDAARQMETALARGDLNAWAEADDRFHLTLLDIHGNRRLRGFVSALNDQVHRARMVTLRLREPPFASNAEHRAILATLAAGDPEAARSAFLAHRQRAAKELIAILVDSGIGQL